MTDDIDRLVREAAQKQQVPLLGQQKPVMHGLNINGMTMTINEIEQLPEREFRELVLAVIINLVGGIYAPPIVAAEEPPVEDGPIVSPHTDDEVSSDELEKVLEDDPEYTEVPPELDTDE